MFLLRPQDGDEGRRDCGHTGLVAKLGFHLGDQLAEENIARLLAEELS